MSQQTFLIITKSSGDLYARKHTESRKSKPWFNYLFGLYAHIASSKQEDYKLLKIRIIDITLRSAGIIVKDFSFLPFVKKGRQIPSKESEPLKLQFDDQDEVHFGIREDKETGAGFDSTKFDSFN